MNDYTELLKELKNVPKVVLYEACKDAYQDKNIRGVNVGKTSHKGGLMVVTERKKQAIFDYNTRFCDRSQYRARVASLNNAKKAAKRAILEHFQSVRWYTNDNGVQRFVPMEATTFERNPLYKEWTAKVDKLHRTKLEQLEQTYFERIDK